MGNVQQETSFDSTAGMPAAKRRGDPICLSTNERIFLRATDLGLVAALIVVPFVNSGRIALGQFALVVAACWMTISWAIFQGLRPQTKWNWTRVELLLLAGVGLGLLQITHLPADVLSWLSPQIAEKLTAWNTNSTTGGTLGEWTQLSLTPFETRSGIAMLLAYGLIFLVTVQRIGRLEDVERLLRWISISVVAMAAFGLIQLMTSNGKFFWIYEHPFTTTDSIPKGAFFNRNHFAQFLALGIGPLIWCVLQITGSKRTGMKKSFEDRPNRSGNQDRSGNRDLRIAAVIVGLGAVMFAGILSLSRGGMIAMLLASVICVGILFRRKLISGKLFAGLIGVGLLVTAFLGIYGYRTVSNRLDYWESNGRWMIWQANLSIFSDFPLVGTGIGSHREAYPMYLDLPFFNKEFTHAESSWVQIASETGLAGLSLAGLATGLCLFWCLRGLRLSQARGTTTALAAVTASLIASCAHAFVDVVWYIPGCMVLLMVLAACACRLFQMVCETQTTTSPAQSPSVKTVPRLAWVASLATVAVLATWMVQTKWHPLAADSHWHEYLRLSLSPEVDEQDRNDWFRRRMSALARAAKLDPNDARLQLHLAREYLELFGLLQAQSENQMTITQIRDAALASKFESRETLDEWLARAFGTNAKILDTALKHTRRALSLCPLQGSGYLYLDGLCFLELADRDDKQAYLEQALSVRPHNAEVLMAAGQNAWASGENQQAIEYWRDAFHRNRLHRKRLIDSLVAVVPASFFIDNFDPDWEALQELKKRYRETGRAEDYAVILRRYAQAGEQRGSDPEHHGEVYCWLEAKRAFEELNEIDQALRCMQRAVQILPNAYNIRYGLGLLLYQQQRFAEASEHLEWCARRKPQNRYIQSLVERTVKKRLEGKPAPRTANQHRQNPQF